MGCCVSQVAEPTLSVVKLPDLFQTYLLSTPLSYPFLSGDQKQLIIKGGPHARWARWKVRVMSQKTWPIEPQFYSSNCHKPCPFDSYIDKDINRTLPLVDYFRPVQNQLKLGKILRALAHFFPKVGYTQGLNFVIGLILLVSKSELESFEFFAHLALHPDFFTIGFYDEQFKLYSFYVFLVQALMQLKLPAVLSQIKAARIDESTWLFKFVQPSFINFLPLQVVIQFWDFIIFTDGFALVYLSVALLKQLEAQLSEQLEDSIFITIIKKLQKNQFFNRIRINRILSNAYSYRFSKEQIAAKARTYCEKTQRPNEYASLYQTYDCPESSQRARVAEIYRTYLRPKESQFRNEDKNGFMAIEQRSDQSKEALEQSYESNPQQPKMQVIKINTTVKKRILSDNKSMVKLEGSGTLGNLMDIQWPEERHREQGDFRKARQKSIYSENIHQFPRAHEAGHSNSLSASIAQMEHQYQCGEVIVQNF